MPKSKTSKPHSSTNKIHDSVPLDETYRPSIWKVALRELYPGWFLDHLDPKSIKIVLRTWLQYWVCFLLTIIGPTAKWLGPSGYVINIGSAIEASGGISIATSILIGVGAVVFLYYGVLCAAVANAITWHLRGYPTKQQIMLDLVERGLCPDTSDSTCLIEQLQRGVYLETRCSVIHLFAMIWALSSIGWVSCKYRIFTLSWLFFGIPLSLSSVSTVVIPYFDPWHYARAIVVPISLSSCTRVFFSCIIFPTTSNRRFMCRIAETIENTRSVAAEFLNQQETLQPSSTGFFELHAKTRRRLHTLFKVTSLVQTDKLMSRFEISYSRFLPHHLARLHLLSLEITSSLSNHLFFFTELEKLIATVHLDVEPTKSRIHKLSRYLSRDKGHHKPYNHYHPVGAFEKEMKAQFDHLDVEQASDVSMAELDEFYEVVSTHVVPLAQSIQRLHSVMCEWVRDANNWRTYSLLHPGSWRKHQLRQVKNANNLITTLHQLMDHLDNYKSCEPDNLAIYRKMPVFTREMSAYYGFATISLAKRMMALAEYLVNLDHKRPKPTVLMPFSGQVKSWRQAFSGLGKLDLFNQTQNLEESYEEFKPRDRVQARNPDKTLPQNKLQVFGGYIERLIAALNDELVLFALKRAFFTATCFIPIYCRPTVHLYFSKRLGWASAMVALTTSRQAVDGIYGFVVRSYFTVYGCAIACVGWYIARGNPYGHAAVMGVLFAYLSWHRHFCNHLNAVSPIILALSIVIVQGGSYAAANYHAVGLELSPGWEFAWVRCVCVLAGLLIAMVGTIFPRPYTGKTAIRNLQGVMISQLTDLLSTVQNFAMVRYDEPEVATAKRIEIFETRLVRFFSSSQSADTLRQFMRFEPPLSGIWPKNRYRVLINNQQEVAQILWMAYLMFGEVDEVGKVVPQLLWLLGWTSPNITQSTYSLMYMCSRSIVSAEALPAITPSYLSEMHADKFKLFHQQFNNDTTKLQLRLEYVSTFLARLLYERLDGMLLMVKGLVGESFDVDTRAFRFDSEFSDGFGLCPRS